MVGTLGSTAGSLAGAVIARSMAKKDAKRQRQLQEKLDSLSTAQMQELNSRIQSALGELAKQRVVLEYLGAKEEANEIAKIQNKKIVSLSVVALILVGVGFIYIELSKK